MTSEAAPATRVALCVARFYEELAQSEDGHQALFFRLAAEAHGEAVARARLERMLEREAEILAEIGVRPAIH